MNGIAAINQLFSIEVNYDPGVFVGRNAICSIG